MSGGATQAFLDAVISIAVDTRPDRVRQLANNIRKADPASVSTQSLVWATGAKAKQLVTELVDAWRASGMSADEAAGILVGASAMFAHTVETQSVELVWTGPSSQIVPTRKTEQVLLQVIRGAQKRLFLTSFIAYEVSSVLEGLRNAIDRQVDVSILLESSEEHGGSVDRDSIAEMRKWLPDARVLYWGEKASDFFNGKVHAKVAVADGHECFLSSANLTGHAMEKNMEAGVLISGGAIPRNLHDHLDALVTARIIQ